MAQTKKKVETDIDSELADVSGDEASPQGGTGAEAGTTIDTERTAAALSSLRTVKIDFDFNRMRVFNSDFSAEFSPSFKPFESAKPAAVAGFESADSSK